MSGQRLEGRDAVSGVSVPESSTPCSARALRWVQSRSSKEDSVGGADGTKKKMVGHVKVDWEGS